MKTYIAQRPADDDLGDCRVTVQIDDQADTAQPLRHVVHHSPTGFEWGYGGSGPADLALSILADHFGETRTRKPPLFQTRAWALHQKFKWHFLAGMPHAGWTIDTHAINQWLSTLTAEETQP